MNGKIKVDGSWRNISSAFVKIDGVWKKAKDIYTKTNNEWKLSKEPAPNGRKWTKSNIDKSSFSYKIVYGNGMYVVPKSSGGGFLISSDGKTWSENNVTGNFSGLCYGNGVWVATRPSYGLYYSTDGVSWVQSNITSKSYSGVYYANNLWIMGGNYNNKTGIYYSTDGKTWTRSNITNDGIGCVYCKRNTSKWILGGWSTGIYYSNDGKSWSKSNITEGCYVTATKGSNHYIIASNTGNDTSTKGILYSYDGSSWNQTNIKEAKARFSNANYDGGILLIGQDTGSNPGGTSMYKSITGSYWNPCDGIANTKIYSLNCNNGIFIAGTGKGVYYSENGETWTLSDLSKGSKVSYGDKIWVANCSDGIYYSEG
ncbi:WD40/YVTN/BNR-like repeat-containing protein [Senimuribacter intestinalis]|uniref:WD40/YVTN/BNR-like repeat-containing protein n=1 Tax=Senimuribacter intestinalis TaxID=2941507 RepID=UPI00203BEBBA|nr:hypothetical protein [Senimuribacter intestinalis]